MTAHQSKPESDIDLENKWSFTVNFSPDQRVQSRIPEAQKARKSSSHIYIYTTEKENVDDNKR